MVGQYFLIVEEFLWGGNLGMNPREWNQYGMGSKTNLVTQIAKLHISKGKKVWNEGI